MRRPSSSVTLICCLLLAACTSGTTASTTTTTTRESTTTTSEPLFQLPDPGAAVEHVELHAIDDNEMVLAYTTRSSAGHRLWVSVIDDGMPSQPTRVAEGVTDIPLAEFRPSIAVSPQGKIAVAWTSLDSDVYVAISEDGGVTFGEAIRMNTEPRGMQLLPAVTYVGETLHGVWIDPRDAPENAEEPADLYMWTLAGDRTLETNLTDTQIPSVCGCCRPHLEARDGELWITFRNTTADGYRDPYQMTPDTEPIAVTPPTWQIEACPIAGPIAAGDRVIWLDGSTGHARILVSNGPEAEPDLLLDSTTDFRITGGPRPVSGIDDLVLIPGTPESRLIRPDGGSVDLSLPPSASTAAVHGGELVVLGVEGGRFDLEVHDIEQRLGSTGAGRGGAALMG